MNSADQKDDNHIEKLSFFEIMTEVFGWLRIVASPLFAGITIGLIIYFSTPNQAGIIIAISVAAFGLIIGIIWAAKIWKKEGTMNFISKITASPDLDKLDDEKE